MSSKKPNGAGAMATWHLVAGSTGAGKSTAAREIAERVGGVRFSIDEWMTALYWMDCPEKNDFPWALARVGRCEAQIEAVAKQLARVGVSSVLDLGFTTRAQRMGWLTRTKAAGVECLLHVLDVDAEVRWERVCERNRGESGTFAFVVTREMFCFMEERWEAPSDEELGLFGGEDFQLSLVAFRSRTGALRARSRFLAALGMTDRKIKAKANHSSLRPASFPPAFGRAVLWFFGGL